MPAVLRRKADATSGDSKAFAGLHFVGLLAGLALAVWASVQAGTFEQDTWAGTDGESSVSAPIHGSFEGVRVGEAGHEIVYVVLDSHEGAAALRGAMNDYVLAFPELAAPRVYVVVIESPAAQAAFFAGAGPAISELALAGASVRVLDQR